MENSTGIIFKRTAFFEAAFFIVSVMLSFAVIALRLPQYITGTAVNALLFSNAAFAGTGYAVGLGLLTPVFAMSSGVLPLPLLLMIPFIATGNAVLVLVYEKLSWLNRRYRVLAAALAKFIFLYAAVSFMISKSLSVSWNGQSMPVAVGAGIEQMLKWPQLFTALAGGVIMLAVSGTVKRSR